MLNSLVLIVTHKCNIKCKFCGVYASPKRKKRMCRNFMVRMIDEVHAFGIVELIVFTGGEPFLLEDDLFFIVEYAAKKGFLTRIVTNAFWANSLGNATNVLSKLKDLGLSEINFSCDDFHQEFIPLEYIRWANEAAEKVSLSSLIAAKGLKNSRITLQYLDNFFEKKLHRFESDKNNPTNNLVSYSITVPIGWESETISDSDLVFPDDSWKSPCSSILKDIVIDENADLIACCGIGSEEIPETRIGNINKSSLLSQLKSGNEDLILNWLALEGPFGIMRFIKQKESSISFRDRYVNKCHLCHDIFSRKEPRAILQKHIREKLLEINVKRSWLEVNRGILNSNKLEKGYI